MDEGSPEAQCATAKAAPPRQPTAWDYSSPEMESDSREDDAPEDDDGQTSSGEDAEYREMMEEARREEATVNFMWNCIIAVSKGDA